MNRLELTDFILFPFQIRFVGLRPGEKLEEELVGEGEFAEPSPIDKILRIRPAVPVNLSVLHDNLMALEAAAHLNRRDWALERLRELVPEFQSSCLTPDPRASAPLSTPPRASDPMNIEPYCIAVSLLLVL